MTEPVPIHEAIDAAVSAVADLDYSAARMLADEPADRLTLAEWLRSLDYARMTLNGIASEVARLLADLMEHDREQIGSLLVTRSRNRRETWDGDAARSAALIAIRNRLALDMETGELVPQRARVVEEAVTLAYSVTSTAPKAKLLATGLRSLGLRADDYRQVTEDGPYRVEVVEITDVAGDGPA
jgi:hypothetical protein